ncbi:MAG: hypothetical protein IKQ75_00590 [Bacteroidales bacterium]|nr:hypothetical protein [Bacteroidales bacterium]MBR6160345.1 hypothetical protein [Bacteroidales bacterium]
MKKSYKTKEQKLPEAAEPVVAYNRESQFAPDIVSNGPNDYLTLEQFGEFFHQKLDDCYEKLQNTCQ